jgi:hypothetical protein
MTRTLGKIDVIRQAGSEPAVADALNRAAIAPVALAKKTRISISRLACDRYTRQLQISIREEAS